MVIPCWHNGKEWTYKNLTLSQWKESPSDERYYAIRKLQEQIEWAWTPPEIPYTQSREYQYYQEERRVNMFMKRKPKTDTIVALTRIPKWKNDGTKVDLNPVDTLFLDAFGGFTYEALSTGVWKSPEGKIYREMGYTLWTCVQDTDENYRTFYNLLTTIGTLLQQECMLMVWNGEVTFITIEKRNP